ncbi:hypothetical protein Hanom_Chr12g01133701 [Helianthus anomalus]
MNQTRNLNGKNKHNPKFSFYFRQRNISYRYCSSLYKAIKTTSFIVCLTKP